MNYSLSSRSCLITNGCGSIESIAPRLYNPRTDYKRSVTSMSQQAQASYIEQIGGYIADNPNIDFERCDGRVFSYYEVNTANMSATNNT